MSVIKRWNTRQAAFTIVELLIVIVVIAILATISIVAYNGIQARANDAKIRQAVAQVEKAVRMYAAEYGNVIRGGHLSTAVPSGDVCVDGHGGFFASGNYACTTEDVLVSKNLLPPGFTSTLPKNTYFGNTSIGTGSLMFYSCLGIEGKYVLFWTLRSPTASDTANLENVMTECNSGTLVRDSWGMRAAKIIQL